MDRKVYTCKAFLTFIGAINRMTYQASSVSAAAEIITLEARNCVKKAIPMKSTLGQWRSENA